jgi:hypothetical protein
MSASGAYACVLDGSFGDQGFDGKISCWKL